MKLKWAGEVSVNTEKAEPTAEELKAVELSVDESKISALMC